MENDNNLMDIKEEDLKFIPLKVDNPFSGNESDWFPLVNLDSPNINNFINNFIFGFSTPMVSGKIDDNSYKNIEYFNDNQNYMDENEVNPENNFQENNQPNMGYNQQGYDQTNMGYNQQNIGYNQPEESGYIKFNTGINEQSKNKTQNYNNLGVNYEQYPKEGYGEELISYEKGYINNLNSNLNSNLNGNLNNNLNRNLNGGFLWEDDIEDLPHIKILREYSFLEFFEEDLRDGNKEKINNIFTRIEGGDNSILNAFKLYEIPYPMASIIVKKIINDVLDYE